MRTPLIIANWKSNPSRPEDAVSLVKKIEDGVRNMRGINVVIAPPFLFLQAVKSVQEKTKLGAQDSFWKDAGPYTGAVSWRHLKAVGAHSVIVGHSERKIYFGETDEIINKKVKSLLGNAMRVILCVGEKERLGGEIPDIVREQLEAALAGVPKDALPNLTVAYEPVWAISTTSGARPDTPKNAFQVAVFIRKILTGLYGKASSEKVRIIYGGSVNSGNILPFLRDGKMEGALVGSASLNPKEFIKIIHTAHTR